MIVCDMPSTIKQIAILGSTGSVGRQTIDVVRASPDRFRIIALAAGKNIDLLAKQIEEFKPLFVYCQDEEARSRLPRIEHELLSMEDIARHPQVDTVVAATSGKSGLHPILAAVKAGKRVAIANKEPLVMLGEQIMKEAKLSGAQMLPVDSEHSAIWQCLNNENQKAARIILTASGGPFRHYSPAQLREVTPEQALRHPSWQMGRKVTIDSATLMNKGLEVIEAHWLFDAPFDIIHVLIHPQSIIHSMVEFADGSIKAQLSHPDMRLPIQYALSYPERLPNPELPRLDWSRINKFTFEQPDFDTFRCLKLAIEAGRKGGTYPTALCAADEVAVELFLSGHMRLTDIAALVERTLEEHRAVAHPTLDEVMKADAWARQRTMQLATGDNP